MAELDTTYISDLPSGAASGGNYLAQDDGANTTKVTVDNAVGASAPISTINGKIGSTALPTTAQTITGAIAEHESDIIGLNDRFTYTSSSINPDFNNFVKSGVYSLGASSTNAPFTSDTGWSLIVYRYGNDGYVKQEARRYNEYDEMFVRTCSNGTWTGWNVLKQRVLIPTGTTKKFTLKTYSGYLIQIYGHLWFVQTSGSTSTPFIVTSLAGTGTTITCTAASGEAAVNIANSSGYQWACTIMEIGL